MKTIHKYEIKANSNELEIPEDAKPLTVQIQDGKPYLWILLDTDKPLIKRYFFPFGTGHDIERNILQFHDNNNNSLGDYIGTFQMPDFGLVFHLFEIIK